MTGRTLKYMAVTLMLTLGTAALSQSLVVSTTYGGLPANADRVLITGEDGRWREVKGEQGAYSLDVGSLRYSLAIVCFEPAGPHVTVYRFLVEELPALHHDCAGRSDLLAPRYRVRGEVVAHSFPENDSAEAGSPARRQLPTVLSVHHGALQLSVVAGFNTNFNVPVPGNLGSDLLALQSQASQPPERAVLHRNVDLSTASRFMFDMGSPDALELDRWTLSLGQPTDTTPGEAPAVSLSARLMTCGGVAVDMGSGLSLPDERSEIGFSALPEHAAQPCDTYELMVMELEPGGNAVRLTAMHIDKPQSTELALPPVGPMPVIDTVGTDPLRARLAWVPDQTAVFLVGGLTDGNVRWSFVQSPMLPPSVTLPAWGADAGVPQLRGGAYQWHFGTVRSEQALQDVLGAYSQTERVGQYAAWTTPATPLTFSVWLTGGVWLPLAADLPGGR